MNVLYIGNFQYLLSEQPATDPNENPCKSLFWRDEVNTTELAPATARVVPPDENLRCLCHGSLAMALRSGSIHVRRSSASFVAEAPTIRCQVWPLLVAHPIAGHSQRFRMSLIARECATDRPGSAYVS